MCFGKQILDIMSHCVLMTGWLDAVLQSREGEGGGFAGGGERV